MGEGVFDQPQNRQRGVAVAAGEEGLAGRGAIQQLSDQPAALIDRRGASGATKAVLTCTQAPLASAYRPNRYEPFLASSHRRSPHPPTSRQQLPPLAAPPNARRLSAAVADRTSPAWARPTRYGPKPRRSVLARGEWVGASFPMVGPWRSCMCGASDPPIGRTRA